MAKKKTDIIDWLVTITIVIFLFEVLLQGPVLLIFLLLFSLGVYYGRKQMDTLKGKVIFWSAVFCLTVTIMNTSAFQFLVFTAIIYLLYRWYRARKAPSYYQPSFTANSQNGEMVLQQKPLFTNKWFGRQQTEKTAYAWQDVNIQTGVGDAVIDLNYTVLPKEEAVIFIRNVIGNIQIIVPYEVEVSFHHTVFFGSAEVLDYQEANIFNKVLHLQTENYQHSRQKVKIFTSMLIGKIEVKRV